MSEENLPALYEELERLGAEAARWAGVEASESTAMVHVGSNDPEKVRQQMIEVRREAREKTREIEAAAEKVRREIRREVEERRKELDRQKWEMEERMRAAMAALEPLQKQVKQMEEGIWTVNLYLGTSEEVVTLRTGEPTPIDTPIHLRTSVLAMDEEVAAFPVEKGEPDWQGMDYRDIEMFDRWLTENPEHLTQVLPEERGIVVFTPRRTAKIYHEDPIVNQAMNEGNFESYWLIRNGENLYRLRTNFKVGRNLMPVTSEFTALFRTERYNHETREYETVDILPGSPEWTKAEEAQDAKRRHYMRVALIVQGLIDRTEMFKPLHAAVNVMQQATYDDGLVVVIDDTDKAIQSSREPYADWIRRLNADLRPGMRILGIFRGDEWSEYEIEPERWSRAEGNRRISPHRAERPPENTLLLIEGQREFDGQKGLVVKYKRTEKVYDPKAWIPIPERPGYGYRGGDVLPKQRASAIILRTDKSIIPFDLVTEQEMQDYLDARTERHAYADMFPLLQAAIEAKRAEREAEAPFRDLLTRVLADDNGQTTDEVAPHIDALVHRFKLGNKWHRPLVSMSEGDEAKAIRLIRSEYRRIVGSGADERRDQRAVDAFRTVNGNVMFVGRLSSGKYVAFAPQPRRYGADVVAHNLWVTEYTTGKTARTITTREWVVPGVRGNKMTEIYRDERWDGWDTISTAKDDVTDDEMDALVVEAKDTCMRDIQSSAGPQAEFLAIGHDRERKALVVYAHDGVHGAPPRAKVTEEKYMAGWYGASLAWERKDGEVVTQARQHRQRGRYTFEGTYTLGAAPGYERKSFDNGPEADRPLLPPWGKGGGYYDPKPAVIEVDDEVLAIAERVTKASRKVNRTVDTLKAKVHPVMRYVEQQQVDQKIAAIKAKFLSEYPDEEMWEERQANLTKDVRADVKTTDNWHFKRFVPIEGGNGHHVHDRDDQHLSLDRSLRALIDSGVIEWDGLTVGDVYALLDVAVPDIYEPVQSLLLVPPVDEEDADT